MRVLLDIAGDVQLNRDLTRISDHTGDLRPAFQAIADLWIDETRQQFADQGRHASGGWTPLSRSTIDAKRRAGLRPEILRATDTLRLSLTARDDPNMILDVRRDELAYGSKVPYAGFHQTGTSRMPQRRPVELTETARKTSVKILQRFILGGGR